MRFLFKLLMKFVTLVVMVVVMGAGVRYGQRYIMKAAGVPEMPQGTEGMQGVHFASEEADLMSTVFKSALRLFSGSATRNELAGELSDKLYAGRGDAGTMAELGIELVKPGENQAAPPGVSPSGAANGAAAATHGNGATPAGPLPPGAKSPAKRGESAKALVAGQSPKVPEVALSKDQGALLSRIWGRMKVYSVELILIPVVLFGMVVVHRVRRRKSPEDAFMLPDMSLHMPSETEAYDMKHKVHSLKAEEFELLVALIYQRQGYRVSMPAGLSGGRGADFTLTRKAERVLVQCKRLSADTKVPVERVKELHEAVVAANATRGIYVASCGFTWDARNYAKANGVMVINARTLDALLTVAKEKPEEDLLAVAQWAPTFMKRVEVTPPICPACEAKMDQLSVSNGAVWVCSQRPECRGRRSPRSFQKPPPSSVRTMVSDKQTDGIGA